MTVVNKNFAAPVLPTPGGAYSAVHQSQFQRALHLFFTQLDSVLTPLVKSANTNNYAAITTATSNYTASTSDHTILCDATSGSITVLLPAAATVSGRMFNIKKVDSTNNTVTIDADGSETIDGETTKIIELQWVNVVVHSNGTNWYIL